MVSSEASPLATSTRRKSAKAASSSEIGRGGGQVIRAVIVESSLGELVSCRTHEPSSGRHYQGRRAASAMPHPDDSYDLYPCFPPFEVRGRPVAPPSISVATDSRGLRDRGRLQQAGADLAHEIRYHRQTSRAAPYLKSAPIANPNVGDTPYPLICWISTV